MTEVRRYLDDPGTPNDVRELLGAAGGGPPPLPPEVRRQLAERVGAMATLGIGTSSLLVKLGATAVVLGLVGGGIAVVATNPRTPESGPAQAAPAVGVQDPAPEYPAPAIEAPVVAVPVAEEPAVDVAPEVVASPRPVARPRPVVAAPSPSAGPSEEPSSDDLMIEAALLERARRDIATQPRRALDTAREHLARFPRGQLAAERELIAVEALIHLGRFPEARRRARPLSRTGLYAERVRSLLDGAPGGAGSDEAAQDPAP